MEYLVDTGVLLRLVNRRDALHQQIFLAVNVIRRRGHQLVTTPQNMSEFWNVCTRPSSARGGFGYSAVATHHRLRLLERLATVLPETPAIYLQWKKLLQTYQIMGVQVHDARMVAAMLVHRVDHLLTLNLADFRRYKLINVVSPADVESQVPRRERQ